MFRFIARLWSSIVAGKYSDEQIDQMSEEETKKALREQTVNRQKRQDPKVARPVDRDPGDEDKRAAAHAGAFSMMAGVAPPFVTGARPSGLPAAAGTSLQGSVPPTLRT